MAAALLGISDVHLSEGKGQGASRTAAELIEHAARGRLADRLGLRPEGLELALDGDVLDLDVGGPSREPGEHAVSVLGSHPELHGALRSAALRGVEIVVVAGNHDAALASPGARAALDAALGARCTHRTWFHRSRRTGAHVEHGHLYDPACAGAPEATLGGLGARHAHLAFPGLDPEGIDSLPASAYARHLGNVLAADPAHARRVMLACASFLRMLAGVGSAEGHEAQMMRLASAAIGEIEGLDAARLLLHARRVAQPMTPDAFAQARAWEGYKDEVSRLLADSSRDLQAIYRAPAVVMGHSHVARDERLPSGAALLNSGCWNEDGGTFALVTTDPRTTGVYRWPGMERVS